MNLWVQRGSLILLLGAIVPLLEAQADSGQQTPAPTTVSPSPGADANREQPATAKPAHNPRDPATFRPGEFTRSAVYVRGKVIFENGDPAPPETRIQRVCGGHISIEGNVHSKGEFILQLGRDGFVNTSPASRAPSGASSIEGVEEKELVGCELYASLPGFRSDQVALAGGRNLSNPNIGTLTLRRLEKVEGFTISATTLLAPKDARKSYEQGAKELKAAKFDKAIAHFERAVTAFPRYAIAWQALGLAQEAANELEKAEASYKKAIEADARYISPYLQLANLSVNRQDWAAVQLYSANAIQLNPVDLPQAYYLNAVGSLQLGDLERAEKSARQAKEQDPSNHLERVDYFLAIILAKRGKFEEAADLLRRYMQTKPAEMAISVLEQQLQQIETLSKETAIQ